MAISVPEGGRLRQPDLPADHDRPDPAGGRRRHPPPDRLDGRGAAASPSLAPAAARRSCSSSARWRSGGWRPRSSLGPLSVTPLLLAIALGLGSLGGRRAASGSPVGWGFGPLAAPPATGRPGRGCSSRRRRRRTAGSARARRSACPCVWAAVCLVAAAARRLRGLVHPVGDDQGHQHRRPGWPRRPHRPDAARPDRPDVPLPQRPDRGPPGVVAVVGLAARPQAGLVLPGGLRRRHVGLDLRRRQPRDLVAGRPGHGLRGVHGVSSGGAWPWP